MVWAAPFGTAMWEGLGGFCGPPIGDFRQEAPSWCEAQVARPAETILVCDHLVFEWGLMARELYYPAPRHLREPDLTLPNGGTVPEGLDQRGVRGRAREGAEARAVLGDPASLHASRHADLRRVPILLAVRMRSDPCSR